MIVKDEIKTRINDFVNLCKSHKVKYLYAFGSSATDSFDSDSSDIDLVVELDSIVWVMTKKYLEPLKQSVEKKL